jgi:hypothetical protein
MRIAAHDSQDGIRASLGSSLRGRGNRIETVDRKYQRPGLSPAVIAT